ncbi:MAG: hypothetical protein ACOYIH_09765 [Candidatus Fimadaptatus sp.]|jgi:hypothetical protein
MASYLEYLMGTVGAYNKNVKQKLLDIMGERRIVTFENGPTLFNEEVCLGLIPQDLRLAECLKKSARAVKVAEFFEYAKSYRYSVVMKVAEPIDDVKVKELSSAGQVSEFNEEAIDCHDNLVTETGIPSKVYYVMEQNEYRFKLCFEINKYDSEGNVINRKFPVLVVAHKTPNLVEIRYDSMPSYIGNNDVFYLTCINKAIVWIENTLKLSITDKDAPSERIRYIVQNREALHSNGEVTIIGQGMKFGNGSSADLFVGSSESGVLPLIGELRQFLSDNEDSFKEVPELQRALENFLLEKERDSDWPWLSLRLCYLRKKIEIKYTTEMYGMGMCRIMFIENTKYDAEAMSYAIKYITEGNSDHPAVKAVANG